MAGRNVPELPLYTFRDSGEQVRVRKLGPTTIQRISEAIRKEAAKLPDGHPNKLPEPPVEQIDIGGVVRNERNDRNPDYLRRMQKWIEWQSGELNERFLRVCAVQAIDPILSDEQIEARVEEIEAVLAIEGVELPRDPRYNKVQQDRILYLMHVCFGSQEDMQDFYNAMIYRTAPQEDQVDEEVRLFRTAE
jgi:hypothetical protein